MTQSIPLLQLFADVLIAIGLYYVATWIIYALFCHCGRLWIYCRYRMWKDRLATRVIRS